MPGPTSASAPFEILQERRDWSIAASETDIISNRFVNELRVQYATRSQSREPGSQAGTGPASNIATRSQDPAASTPDISQIAMSARLPTSI